MIDINKLKIPLIVGVSGHIDISTPENVLAGKLTDFWQQLRQKVGAETPIILLSSIASGADHLAVKYRPADVPYCVVLPFDACEYEKNFSGQSLKDYHSDLAGAFKCITCGNTVGDYTLASNYVRTHSDILLTLWDGCETLDASGRAKNGGTYFLLRKTFQLDDLLISAPEKTHLVVNIPVERQKVHSANEKKLLDESAWGTLNCTCQGTWQLTPGIAWDPNSKFAQIIADVCQHNRTLPAAVEEKSYLHNTLYEKYPRQYEVIKDDYARYDYFDQTALENQKKHKREFRYIAFLSLLAGIASQLWGGITFSDDFVINEKIIHWDLLAYCVSFLIALLFYLYVKKQSHYHKYIRPRVLAELLRLKIFWKTAGIPEEFFDGFLKNQANFGITLPICNWEIMDPPVSAADQAIIDQECQAGFPTVYSAWIEDQKKFYRGYIISSRPDSSLSPAENSKPEAPIYKKIIKIITNYFKPYHRRAQGVLWLKRLCFISTIVFAMLLLFIFWHKGMGNITSIQEYDPWNLRYYREFAVGLCPFFVACLGWLLEKSRWDTIGRRYQELYQIFARASERLPQLQTPDEKRQMIKELMQLCHQENTDWESIRNASQPEPML